MKRSLQVLLLLFPFSAVFSEREAPVCSAKEGKCSSQRRVLAGKCELAFAESSIQTGRLGLYSTIARSPDEYVTDQDIMIPLFDVNKNEWSPWHDIFWPSDQAFPNLLFESYFLTESFLPGVGSLAACSKRYFNIELDENHLLQDSAGVHRSKNETFGSFSYYYGVRYKIVQPVQPGEELVMPCRLDDVLHGTKPSGRKVLDLTFLRENSICIESFDVKQSTLSNAGRGAFAKRAYHQGEIVTSSPLVHFDRSQLEIVEQTEYDDDSPSTLQREHGIRYFADQVHSIQLLVNYCFGNKESNVMLLPYGPGVNLINHNRAQANVFIRWSTHEMAGANSMKGMSPMAVTATKANADELLVFEYVAMRDIQPGEEIFLDYGDEWINEWKDHLEEWAPDAEDEKYVSAADYVQNMPDGAAAVIRTLEEQEADPYPETIQTACYFQPPRPDEKLKDLGTWSFDYFECLRPCDVIARDLDENGNAVYSVTMKAIENLGSPTRCGDYGIFDEEGLFMEGVPAYAVQLVDSPYSSDVWQADTFRQEISLPRNLLPSAWLAADPNPSGDFLRVPLRTGQIEPIRWADDGDIVTPNAYLLGLPKRVRQVLLEYCNKMGITDILRHVTQQGNALKPGQNVHLSINGNMWYLQR